MRSVKFALAAVAPLLIANTPVPPPDLGLYTNEEEVYFDREAGRTPVPWFAINLREGAAPQFVDPYGYEVKGDVAQIFKQDVDHIVVVLPSLSRTSILRRARPVTCWGSVPKFTKKPDGTDDWYFAAGLKVHDQGGRAQFGGRDTGAPPVILRMRNVVWPTGTNKPSLVLYVHKPANPDHAESYSWADPDAKRIGINLRWMQASCSID